MNPLRSALFLCLISGLLLSTVGGISKAASTPSFDTARERYRPGAIVTIRLYNDTDHTITMSDPWSIEETSSGDGKAQYYWTDPANTVAPGEERVWNWEQHARCDGACENVWAGELVGPGRYTAKAVTSDGTLETTFDIGRYFTLGFDGRPHASFTVFAADADAVKQMKAQASASDKTMAVSGIVAEGLSYNAPWSYTMDPASIVLGEVFTEVCDGSPYYVEKHKADWLGQRWCPWSSYVDHVGR